MTNQERSELIKNSTKELLEKMTFKDFEVSVAEEKNADGENLIANIETAESNLLIGQYGTTLKAFQHIVRLMVRRQTDDKFKFLLDVNGYLRQKTESISEITKSAARQAISEMKPVVLRPMSAYERRLVHLELDGNENIRTESIGEGEDRRVVIKPVGDLEKLEQKNKED
jgi:spoIIIJ-associated protein